MTQLSLDDYLKWMKTEQGCDFEGAECKNRFNTNISAIFGTITSSNIVDKIESKLVEWSNEYESETGSTLFMDKPKLDFRQKTYDSMIDKTFRVNALWNRKFPDSPPNDGWITAENVYHRINDLVRTYLVCKFIDGPKFLTEKLIEFCHINDTKCKCYSQERDEGYYAYHFYLYFDVSILGPDWIEQKVEAMAEIQVTTQLQEVLKDLTHHYFEITRLEPKSYDDKWKWEVASNRFRSAYMCHTLHLLEAIILDLRKKA